MVNIELKRTEDGSYSIFNVEKNESYHSIHGAVQESMHVFISAGYRSLNALSDSINILEIGFGTGLNTLLTISEFNSQSNKIKSINYVGIEPFPLKPEIIEALEYSSFINQAALNESFLKLHQIQENQASAILPGFQFTRLETPFQSVNTNSTFDLVYFDAFSPEAEPLLWTKDIFMKLFKMMNKGGLLVTYCSKGVVRRTMQECGFTVERIPGPPGKHEMLRASVK